MYVNLNTNQDCYWRKCIFWYWFLVLGLNGGYPLGVATGVKGGLLFFVGAFGRYIVVPDKPQKVENFHFTRFESG